MAKHVASSCPGLSEASMSFPSARKTWMAGTSPAMTKYSSSMQNHLFVYGTLMRGFDHAMAKLLSRSAKFVGPARCRGRLYLVKHYPGLVLSDDPNDIVF